MNRAIREKFALADLFFALEAAAEGPERSVQPGAGEGTRSVESLAVRSECRRPNGLRFCWADDHPNPMRCERGRPSGPDQGQGRNAVRVPISEGRRSPR